ncbi:MAG: diaminopimelate epimerase [Spirochaetes bacterium]|nr:diaminopimelate epimerase [Spirochaetota bacterium]
MRFTKMHGTGNDYIYINAIRETVGNPKKLAVKMCDRHFGVGSDGLILILPSKSADFRMRIFNPDGSEAEMCGNGIRAFGKYLYEKGLTKNKDLSIETNAGSRHLSLKIKSEKVQAVMINMGEPILRRDRIPMIGKPGMVIDELLPLDDGTRFNITSLSMGNPHVVIFVEDIHKFPVEKYGPEIERNTLFPNKTNVEFVQILNDGEIEQRTWERGAGETLSCGTGAAAATVACILNKRTGRKITVHLRGGDLQTHWDESSNCVFLTGQAVEVFEGQWPE